MDEFDQKVNTATMLVIRVIMAVLLFLVFNGGVIPAMLSSDSDFVVLFTVVPFIMLITIELHLIRQIINDYLKLTKEEKDDR